MNCNITRYMPEELEEALIEDIIEEMRQCERDEDVRHNRRQWREILIDCGYAKPQVEQVLDVYFPKCTTCGRDATHLWASYNPDGSIGSMMGPDKFSPSCDGCSGSFAGDIPNQGVVRAPLDFDPETKAPRIPTVDEMVSGLFELGDAKIEAVIVQASTNEPGLMRNVIWRIVDAHCRAIAKQSQNELHQTSHAEVLLDVIADVSGGTGR